MSFQYEILSDKTKTGLLTHNGVLLTAAYSGHGEGLNNVALQAVPNVGPIPVGLYKMLPAKYSEHLGPLTIELEPVGHTAFGRSLFRIHGDNAAHNESASHGCICAGAPSRKFLNDCILAGDNMLRVIA